RPQPAATALHASHSSAAAASPRDQRLSAGRQARESSVVIKNNCDQGQRKPARDRRVVHALGADCMSTPGTMVARAVELGRVK
ncbi:MAG: hypothetical protein J2P23_09220, partial [Microlunatus sp.]|nr:hypothetical protein [Microlunatus sp.]